MQKIRPPQNRMELKMLKHELRAKIEIEEQIIGFSFGKLKTSLANAIKSAVTVYTKQHIARLIAQFIQSKILAFFIYSGYT